MDPHLRLALLALLCAICALWLKDSQGDLGRSITELWLCVGTCHPFAVLDLTHTNHNAAVKKLIRLEWFFKSQWRSRTQKPLKHNLTFISPSLLLMSDTGVWVDAVMSYCKFLFFLLPKMYYTLSKETLKWALQIVFEAVLIQWICSLWDPSVLRSHQIFIFTAT